MNEKRIKKTILNKNKQKVGLNPISRYICNQLGVFQKVVLLPG